MTRFAALALTGAFVAAVVPAARAKGRLIPMGDMRLFEEHYEAPREPPLASKDGLLGIPFAGAAPWEGGIMPVVFSSSVSPERQQLFLEACAEWTAFTNVRCVPRAGHLRYQFVSATPDPCSSTVGAPTASEFGVTSLGYDSCWEARTLRHEIGHAFGLKHEHQRPDRHHYVIIDDTCMAEGLAGSYQQLMSNVAVGDYDFDSIMHYGPFEGARSDTCPVIRPLPQFAERAANMGRSAVISPLDRAALASIYNLPPAPRRDSGSVPRFERVDFLHAMLALDAVYRGELHRADGLSIAGGPDLLGMASWIFDVYLTSRAAGYTQGEAFYNVRAWISQSEEWWAKNPHLQPMPILPAGAPIQLDRGEYLNAMQRLDAAYRTELLRPDGLSLGGRPDFLGIAAWIFDVYLNARLDDESPGQAWSVVLAAIRDSDEYKRKH